MQKISNQDANNHNGLQHSKNFHRIADEESHSAEEFHEIMKEDQKVEKISKRAEEYNDSNHRENIKKEDSDDNEDQDSDQRFIDKQEQNNQQDNRKNKGDEAKEANNQAEEQGSNFFKRIKNLIFPKQNQVRTLDNEVGGLEAKEDKGISSKDVWDDRSEEVAKMGSTDTFNTTGMRSVVWNAKKNRLKVIKNAKKNADNAIDALEGIKGKSKNQEGKSTNQISERPVTRMPLIYNSAKMPQIDNWENKSLFEKLKTLKQDKSTAYSDKFGGNKGNDKNDGRGR